MLLFFFYSMFSDDSVYIEKVRNNCLMRSLIVKCARSFGAHMLLLANDSLLNFHVFVCVFLHVPPSPSRSPT